MAAITALPLVLPPTVLGFYLLLALAPGSPAMALLRPFGITSLAFTFEGLVIGSMVYSLPFAVQPIRNAFEAMGPAPWEAAATLRASPLDTFATVALPLARRRVRMADGRITGVEVLSAADRDPLAGYDTAARDALARAALAAGLAPDPG